MTIRERVANCVTPPASARTSSTVVQLLSSKRPGRTTSPMTDTLKLRTSDTMTETSWLGMYSASFCVRVSRSSSAVSPAACTSFTSGSEILPSGLTGTRSEEHTSELQSLAYLVCRLLLEKKKTHTNSSALAIEPEALRVSAARTYRQSR